MESFEQSPDQLEQFLGFMEEDLANVRRVLEFCEAKDLDTEFIVHGKGETVEESSRKTGTPPENVVKTLVFVGEDVFAVLCPGDRRVDEVKLSEVTGSEVRMARPSEVEDSTGYKVGGVSPFDLDIPVYMDSSIPEKDFVKPAAGSRVVGVRLSPQDLAEAVETQKVDVTSK